MYSLLVLCHKKKKKKKRLDCNEFWDVLDHQGSTWGSLRIQEMKAALRCGGVFEVGQPCFSKCDVIGLQMQMLKGAASELGQSNHLLIKSNLTS